VKIRFCAKLSPADVQHICAAGMNEIRSIASNSIDPRNYQAFAIYADGIIYSYAQGNDVVDVNYSIVKGYISIQNRNIRKYTCLINKCKWPGSIETCRYQS
jgi:hypothetical protein